MDPITHLSQKILVERARQTSQQTPPPPPYTSADNDTESDSDEEDSDSDNESQSPLKLTINAANSIQGSNNLVPTSSTPLADATKFSTLLLHTINQLNNSIANTTTTTSNSSEIQARRNVKVELTINCGITVVGDRNVIGNVGLKPRPPPSALAGTIGGVGVGVGVGVGSNAVVGAKRKAEKENSEDEPETKKLAVDD